MPSWAELHLVNHQLQLIFDALRDDLLHLEGAVLAALPVGPSVRRLRASVRGKMACKAKKRQSAPKGRKRSRPRKRSRRVAR